MRNKQAALHGNARAVNVKKLQSYSTEIFRRIKPKLVRLASWLSLIPQ